MVKTLEKRAFEISDEIKKELRLISIAIQELNKTYNLILKSQTIEASISYHSKSRINLKFEEIKNILINLNKTSDINSLKSLLIGLAKAVNDLDYLIINKVPKRNKTDQDKIESNFVTIFRCIEIIKSYTD